MRRHHHIIAVHVEIPSIHSAALIRIITVTRRSSNASPSQMMMRRMVTHSLVDVLVVGIVAGADSHTIGRQCWTHSASFRTFCLAIVLLGIQ